MTTISSAWIEAVVDDVVPRSPHISSVFLRASLGAWDAGQHVDVRLTAPDGYQAQRSYSIASAPGSERIELAIEKLDEGEVSPYFFDVARPGDTFELRGPIGGHFVWRHSDSGPLLLIAGGSGIAPLMSIVRHWAATVPDSPATLVYSVRTWDDLTFGDELLAIEAREPLLRIVATTTRGAKHRERDYERRLDRELLQDVLASSHEAPRLVYVCGATSFVEVVTTALVDLGIAPSTIRTERFGGR